MFSKNDSSSSGILKKLALGGIVAKVLSSDDDNERSESGFMKKMLIGGILGAIAIYFFQPDKGAARRGRFVGLLKSSKQKVGSPKKSSAADDAVLEARIETEALGGGRYPKGQITLEVVDGIVTLRGQLDSAEDMSALEQDVRKVSGVVEVRNFLHLPDQDAPNKADSLRAGK